MLCLRYLWKAEEFLKIINLFSLGIIENKEYFEASLSKISKPDFNAKYISQFLLF